MTEGQVPSDLQNTAAGKKKFTGSLYFYFIVMICLNCFALIFFIVRASSNPGPDFQSYLNPYRSIGNNVAVICQVKTNDERAQNLLHYIMNNPPDASERRHTAENIQESGIDLYEKNLQYLDSTSTLIPKDSEMLKKYCRINKELFTHLKTGIQSGIDPGTIENDPLYGQMDEMRDDVLSIFRQY